MIRAIRPSAMAQDDAGIITGWNVAPNVGYTVALTPGSSACGVLLFDADMQALIASGAGLVGTEQPVVLLPQTGQTIGMVDADLGWHLLLTTTGTEAQQTIRIGPAVDLPDEIHPIFADDNMAMAKATAAINAGASYVDGVTVTCPLGIGVGIGDVTSVPVDGAAVVGQIESITWTATPNGATAQAVIRRHTAIAPEAPTAPPVPPSVADDVAETDATTTTSGNVLDNDDGLNVTAVEGLGGNVGVVVTGTNGGEFTIAADGAWTFDPAGDFGSLTGSDTAETSVAYHASNGLAEAMATLTVTVSSGAAVAWTPNQIPGVMWITDEGVVHDYNGTSDYTVTAPPALDCPTSLFFALVTDSIASERTILNQQYGDVKKPWQLYFSSVGRIVDWRTGASSPAVSVGVPAQICEIQSAIASVVMYKDGSSTGGTVGTLAIGYAASAPIYVGKSQAFGALGWYDGRFISGFVVPSAVDTETRQKCEGYLAHTVDVILGVTTLVDALPSDHPHKSAPPTV